MQIVCLDFEGVLVPDIWPHVAERTGVPELKITTRDFKDYRELMNMRVEICKQHHISLKDIQAYIRELHLYDGALDFVNWIRANYQFVILSDTFYEFVPHFIEQLGFPTLFCHTISYNESEQKLKFILRQDNQKQHAVKSFRSLNFKTYAVGDSYNDVTMLAEAHGANLFCAPEIVIKEFPQFQNVLDYVGLKQSIIRCFNQ